MRGTGWFASGEQGIHDIEQVPVKTVDGVVVTVSDLADVKTGPEIRQGAVTLSQRASDGKVEQFGEVVTGIVLKRMGANTKATIDGINSRVALINQALPEGVRFTPFYDQANLIEKAISTVVKALTIAFVFITIVLALFLMNVGATFLVLITIPIAIVMALAIMAFMGLSANLMSLGGIAVAIGMLVDGSVVMIENIFKRLNTNTSSSHEDAQSFKSSVKLAGKEVARPIFFAASIILVVFAPLFSFEGVEAKLFQPMAISIMLAVLCATVVALFFVPALATFLFKRTRNVKPSAMLIPVERAYQRALSFTLLHTKWVVLVVGLLLVSAVALVPKIGTEFVPELEEGTINLRVTLAPSSSLETSLAVASTLEEKLLAFPEVTYALSRIGRAEIGGDPEPVNNIEIYIGLKPVSTWESARNRDELQQKMQAELSQFPGLLLNFSQPIATRVDELLSGVKAQLAVKLFGPDLAVLSAKGREIESVIQNVKGTRDVAMEQIVGEAQLVIAPDRQALSRYGLSVSDIMEVVQDGVGGVAAGQIINGNERYDIYVRLKESARKSSDTIADIRLQSPSGAWLRIGDVASVSYESGPPQIRRDDVQRRVVVQANVQGRDMGSVVQEIQSAISSRVDLPSGYTVQIGGQFESQQRAQKKLSIIVPLSLILIAVLLYLAFNSLGQAMLILINVPLAIIGGVFSLYLSGQYLSVPSSVGFITLFGVAVLNGVVMVESINQRVKGGMAVESAVFTGATSRLRPVLMTAVTSALGLVPMLMSNGVGAEIQRPLASVIVGGLVTATLLTLFVLPVLYSVFSPKQAAK